MHQHARGIERKDAGAIVLPAIGRQLSNSIEWLCQAGCSLLVRQVLPRWLAMTDSWGAPLFFGEFGANDDPNPDDEAQQARCILSACACILLPACAQARVALLAACHRLHAACRHP